MDSLFAAMLGLIDVEQLEGINSTLTNGVFKDPDTLITRDTNHEPLKVGGIYRFSEQERGSRKGKLARIISEEFGSGNIMDTYYRVYYIEQDTLETTFVVVDAKHQRDEQNNRFRLYISTLEPVNPIAN
jgi:hypothetical protein